MSEELAWVYENTAAKGMGLFDDSGNFTKYIYNTSEDSFKILIEVDNIGNIVNAYLYL